MSNHTYKSIELIGTSEKSYAEATRSAIRRAAASMRDLKWFETLEMRGHVTDGEVSEFQVRVKVWFDLED